MSKKLKIILQVGLISMILLFLSRFIGNPFGPYWDDIAYGLVVGFLLTLIYSAVKAEMKG